jgi:AcrR family transcriptional regulator
MIQKRRSTAVRKKQIIDAARKLIIKKGSEHLTVRAVAKEVGLTEAAIYRHFKSKRDMLSFLMSHIMDSMLNELERTATENAHSLETVNIMLRQHLSDIEQRRGMSFQVIAEIISLGDKRLNREVYEKLNTYIDRLRELLSKGVQANAVRDDIDLGASALLLFGMIQGLVNIWALSSYRFDLSEKFDSLWGIFKEAIKMRKIVDGTAA